MKHNKKGFSIVECVVAITLVAIITASAIVIYHVAINTINGRWDKFKTMVMANNTLSIFKASDNVDIFSEDLSNITGSTNALVKKEETKQIETIETTGIKYDLSKKLKVKEIGTVRKKGNDLYVFGNVIDLNNTSASELFKLAKGTINAESFDSGETKTSGGSDEIFKYTIDFNSGSNTERKIDVTLNLTKGKISYSNASYYTGSTANKIINTGEMDMNPIEKYFFITKKWYIKPVLGNNMANFSASNSYIIFNVYKISDDSMVEDTNNQNTGGLQVKFVFDSMNTDYTPKSVEESSPNVTQIQKIISGSSNTTSFDTITGYSSSKIWKCFPKLNLLYRQVYQNKTTIMYKTTYTPSTPTTDEYTDYEVSGTSSNIAYVTTQTTTDTIEFYNSDEKVLFTFTGSEDEIADVLEDIVLKESKLNCKDEVVIPYEEDSNEYTTKYRNMSTEVNIDHISFDSDSANDKYYVSFEDIHNNKILKFTYNYFDMLLLDYQEMVERNEDNSALNLGTLSANEGSKTISGIAELNNSFKGAIVVEYTGGVYTVTAEDDTVIFVSRASKIEADEFVVDLDNEENIQEVTKNIDCGAVKTAYSFVSNDYACFIITTFSEVAFDTSIEPQIKIWLLRTNDLEDFDLEDLADEDKSVEAQNWKEFEDSLGKPYIDYKKG